MERKLVKQGRNALTVTLPAQWLKRKGLKAGNSVDMDVGNSCVTINVGRKAAAEETTVNVRDEERSFIWHKIIAAYIEGYDRITILHNNPSLTQEFTQQLLGLIMEEHTSTKTVLKSIISVPEDNFQVLLRRAGHMFLQQAVLLEELTSGKATFEDVKKQEKLLDTNFFYCLRYLNKYQSQKNAYRYFLLCTTIEFAADQLSRIAFDIKKKDASLTARIKEVVKVYNECIFGKDMKKLYTELRKFRNSLQKRTFIDGLAFTFSEILYNNLGYLVEEKERR